MTHGRDTTYRYGCRCKRCREAHTRVSRVGGYSRRWLAKVRARGVVPRRVHGTYTGYSVYYCKCERCVGAARAYRREVARRTHAHRS